MKKITHLLILTSGLFFGQTTESQQISPKLQVQSEAKSLPRPYNENADGLKDILRLMTKARKEKKNILVQAGGNWCIWCLRFNHFIQNTPELASLVEKKYLYYHLNFSPKNKNEAAFKRFGNPGEKFGYPAFMIISPKGKVLHIQESGDLEEGKGYSLEKTKDFLNKF